MKKKSILSIILCLTLLLSTFSGIAFAAEETGTVENYYSSAKATWENDKSLPDNIPNGKVFAGWYKDEECTLPVYGAADFDADGGAFAKFVDEDVLGIYFQITSGTTTASDETDLRLLTSVDSDKYQEVGFLFNVNEKTQPFTTNKVYTEVYGYKEDGTQITYGPDKFSEESQYIMAFVLSEIPFEAFSTEINVTPTWKTLDGTVVSGPTKTFQMDKIAEIRKLADGKITFEQAGEVQYFITRDHNEVGGMVTRVKYADVGITAMDDNCGDYLLQLQGTTDVQYRPQLVVNLGKTVPVGTKIKFKILIDSDVVISEENKLIVQVKSNTKNAWGASDGVKIPYNSGNTILSTAKVWEEVEFTTTAKCSYLLIVPYCVDNAPYKTAHQDGTYNAVYIDDFSVIDGGYSFEYEEDINYIVTRSHATVGGVASRVTYVEEGITPMDSSCDDYLAKVVPATEYGTEYRPQTIIKLGETMSAGTRVSFKMRVENSAIETGSKFAIQVKSGSDGTWGTFVFNNTGANNYEANTWYCIETVLTNEANELLVIPYVNGGTDFLKTAQAVGDGNAIYIDNIKIYGVGDGEPFTFESDADMKVVSGRTDAAVAKAVVSRVSYEEEGIEAIDNSYNQSGDYLVKVIGADEGAVRPQMYINFGKELAANTKVSFWVRLDNPAIEGTSLAVQVKYGDKGTNGFAYNGNSAHDKVVGQWYKVEMTMSKAADKLLVLFFSSDTNILTNAQTNGNYNVMYIDNLEITAP